MRDNLIQYDKYLVDRYKDDIVDISRFNNAEFVLDMPVIVTKLTHHLLNAFINYRLNGDFMLNKCDFNRSGIYVIKNLMDGQVYVGQSLHLYDRMIQHFANADYKNMNDELYVYGNVFAVNFIYCDKSELNDMETRYIKKYDCVDHGYNKNYGYGKSE